jgi:hypothetical protein
MFTDVSEEGAASIFRIDMLSKLSFHGVTSQKTVLFKQMHL